MQYKGYFDKTDGSPTYAAALASIGFDLMYSGVSHKFLNKLEVSRTTGNSITVDTGGIVSKGRWLAQDEAVVLPVDAAQSGYLRKDYVVVEFDVDTKSATIKISKGNEVQSDPVVNELLGGDNKWQEPLGVINIEGSTIKTEGGVEDKRVIGNQRNTPDFAEPISAPKVTTDMVMMNTGAKQCFASEDTYMQHDGSSLNVKEDGCVEAAVALVISGTSETPPEGVYAANTMYLVLEPEE